MPSRRVLGLVSEIRDRQRFSSGVSQNDSCVSRIDARGIHTSLTSGIVRDRDVDARSTGSSSPRSRFEERGNATLRQEEADVSIGTNEAGRTNEGDLHARRKKGYATFLARKSRKFRIRRVNWEGGMNKHGVRKRARRGGRHRATGRNSDARKSIYSVVKKRKSGAGWKKEEKEA